MKIKLGTRNSNLALVQSNHVKDQIESTFHDVEVELVEIKTLGDRKQGTPEASNCDKQDWIIDLERAVIEQNIDFAVHSSKDIPAFVNHNTELLPILKRANPFDAFIGKSHPDHNSRLTFADLPKHAKIGTASLRRRAELLRIRPDLTIIEHRGNVPTRLKKLDDSDDIMGIILACAGLERLGYKELSCEVFLAEEMMPAVNQGILAAQFSKNNDHIKKILSKLVHPNTHAEWLAERKVVELLEGDCQSAMSIFAQCFKDQLTIQSRVLSTDGKECISAQKTGPISQAQQLGIGVGKQLLEQGAAQIIAAARNS